jgi:hypothetical protein
VGFVATSETRVKMYVIELENVKKIGLSKEVYYEWMIGKY